MQTTNTQSDPKNKQPEVSTYEAPAIIEEQVIKIELQTNFLPDEPPPPL